MQAAATTSSSGVPLGMLLIKSAAAAVLMLRAFAKVSSWDSSFEVEVRCESTSSEDSVSEESDSLSSVSCFTKAITPGVILNGGVAMAMLWSLSISDMLSESTSLSSTFSVDILVALGVSMDLGREGAGGRNREESLRDP